MGLDCTLFPNNWDLGFLKLTGDMLATTTLDLDRDYRLFEKLPGYTRDGHDGGPAPVVDFSVGVYRDDGLKRTREDAYGDPLRQVTAGELAKVDTSETSAWNQAAFAFVRALPPETIVVVYWH